MSAKKILAIVGSASPSSSNHAIIHFLREEIGSSATVTMFDRLSYLPFFEPAQSLHDAPDEIKQIRTQIEQADAIIISTPEYIFSIPAALKNLFEWCVAVNVFSDKPCLLITASAEGTRAHEQLRLLASTLGAVVKDELCLLVKSVKAKTGDSKVTDPVLIGDLKKITRIFLHTLVTIEKKF